MRFLPLLLRRVIRDGSLTLVGPDGTSETFTGENPGPSVTIRVNDPSLDLKLILNPELRFAEAYMDGGLEIAPEDLRDVLRDYGDRTIGLDPRPSYEVVYLLTRQPEEFAGFRAVDARLRVRPSLDLGGAVAASARPAEEIVGDVSAVGVDQIQRQRRLENRLRELRGRRRTEEETRELAELVGEVLLTSEAHGVSGIEGEWDDVLRGKNGYREHLGLADVYGRGRTSAVLSTRVDGTDVRLSIDMALQSEVERMLEEPEYDPSDPLVDRSWFAEPVGAIVVLDREGRVVVAASVPNGYTEVDASGRDVFDERADRSVRMDRTLRKPAFQPPGSVFKPFVAAWALEHLGLDPRTTVECRRDGGPPHYGGVRCWNAAGHGTVDLGLALKGSCNCYFAWLGERFPSAATWHEMARAFGFGEPTGVRRPDAEGPNEQHPEDDEETVLNAERDKRLHRSVSCAAVGELTPNEL